jgi:hypothetical protein
VFRTFRKVCRWVFLILFVLTAALVGTGYVYLSKGDELLHDGLLTKLREWSPESRIELDECKFDWFGRVHVSGFRLTPPDAEKRLLDLPEAIVDLDREAFIQRQEIVIQNVRIVRPKIELVRLADGAWNWQNLPPLPDDGNGRGILPTIQFEDAQVVATVFRDGVEAPATLRLNDVTLQLTPNGRRSLLVKGLTSVENVGRLDLEGQVNIDSRTGSMVGTLADLSLDRDMLKYASSFEPSVNDYVVAAEQKLLDVMMAEPQPTNPLPFDIAGIGRRETDSGQAFANASMQNASQSLPRIPGEIRTVVGSSELVSKRHRIPAAWIGEQDSILGLRADLSVSFKASVPVPGAAPEIRLFVDIKNGEITNTALPFPLEGLTGQIECSDTRIQVQRLAAVNGPTRVEVDGNLYATPEGRTGEMRVLLRNLLCDDRLRNRLSESFGRIYDLHKPTGQIDVSLVAKSGTDGNWKPADLVVTAKECTIMHELFPYPVQDIVGTVKLDGGDFLIDTRGFAGRRPISIKGFVKNPGPEAHSLFEVDVEDLPIDDAFYSAANPKMQRTLNSMGLTGLADVHARFERPPGLGQKTVPVINAIIHDAAMAYEKFPYRVDDLSGRLSFDGLDWRFTGLQGRHGAARLRAAGSFLRSAPGIPGSLTLTVATENASTDESLMKALPPHLQRLWTQFAAIGTLEQVTTQVDWIEGQPPVITLPEIRITNARSLFEKFPYELTGIESQCSYGIDNKGQVVPGLLRIESFSANHAGTRIEAAGFVKTDSTGYWHAHFSRLKLRDLLPNEDLLNALGPGIRGVFKAFAPDRPLTINGALELKGVAQSDVPVTAAWHLETQLTDGAVNVGLDLSDVQGRIISEGSWDGREATVEGTIDLATLKLFDKYRLHQVRGPFRVEHERIIIGSADAFRSGPSGRPLDPAEQLTAEFIGGMLTLNSQALLRDAGDYVIRLNVAQGDLERFAQLYMQSRELLQGKVNGWLALKGKASQAASLAGTGQLQISPARLYRAPVIFQVLNTLAMASQDESAFAYARVDLDVAQEQFLFKKIDLVGSQFQLSGQGTANFDGKLDLTFVSMLPRSTTARRPQVWIPVITELTGLARGVTNLVGVVVEVSGTTEYPQTRVIPARNLDARVKTFMQTLSTLPLHPPAPPRLPPLANPLHLRPF